MNNERLQLSAARTRAIIISLLCLMPIVGMAVDLIAPSLPSMAESLHVSSGAVKSVITLYLIGYALGNFFTGFLADAWGRQKLLRFGLLGFVLASLLPIIFPTIGTLLIARFLQGITIGTVAVTARTIFSDILPLEKLTHMGTLIGTMFGLGPVLGPIIGGTLQYYYGWQSCFTFFLAVSFIGLIAVFFIVPETHLNRHTLHINTIKKNMLEVFHHRVFMGLVFLMGCVYSLIISFHTLAPFLIESELNHSSLFFGRLALYLGLAFLASTFICRALLKKYNSAKLTFIAIHLFFSLAIVGLLLSFLYNESIVLITIISAFMFYCTGTLFPMSMGRGMTGFRHIAGTATAIMYLINILITSLTSFLMGFVNIHNTTALMWVYVSLMMLCVGIYWVFLREKE
jgi:Bcr/CflA subfamily drug resistance transporter